MKKDRNQDIPTLSISTCLMSPGTRSITLRESHGLIQVREQVCSPDKGTATLSFII